MKVAAFAGPMQPLRIVQRDTPVIAADELLVRVGRCGICATDVHIYKGDGLQLPEGFVFGHEFAGTVEQVGSAVTKFKPGDQVTAMSISGCGQCAACLTGDLMFCPRMRFHESGGFGQYMKLPEREAYLLPPPLSLEDGALVEPLAVGLHGVSRSGARYGDKVLVLGAGPIGLAVSFWLKQLGIRDIVVLAASARRREIALQMGATHFLQIGENPQEAMAQALGGPPAIVFECAGIPGAMMQAMQYAAPRGTVVGLGACSEPENIVAGLGLMKELRIQFALTYERRDYQYVIDTLAAGHLEPRAMITQRIGLEQLSGALEGLLQRSPQCKIMVDPWAREAAA